MMRSGRKIEMNTNVLDQGTTGVMQAPEIIINGFSLKFDKPASPRTRRFFESCGSRLEYTGSDVILTGGVIEKSKLLAFQEQVKHESQTGSDADDPLSKALKSCQLKKDNGKVPPMGLAFRRAIASNKIDTVKVLLPHVNINEQGPESERTGLHIATIYCRTELVALLLENGADKTIKDKQSKTPAHYAAESTGDRDFLLRLLGEPQDKLRKLFHPDIEATLSSAAMKEAEKHDSAGVPRDTMLNLFEFSKTHPEFMQGTRKSSNSGKYVFVPDDYDSSDESTKASKMR